MILEDLKSPEPMESAQITFNKSSTNPSKNRKTTPSIADVSGKSNPEGTAPEYLAQDDGDDADDYYNDKFESSKLKFFKFSNLLGVEQVDQNLDKTDQVYEDDKENQNQDELEGDNDRKAKKDKKSKKHKRSKRHRKDKKSRHRVGFDTELLYIG